jgi:hypothetical protein
MGNGALAIGPKLPRPSSTLPSLPAGEVTYRGESWGLTGLRPGGNDMRCQWDRG